MKEEKEELCLGCHTLPEDNPFHTCGKVKKGIKEGIETCFICHKECEPGSTITTIHPICLALYTKNEDVEKELKEQADINTKTFIRFFNKIKPTKECWLWQGQQNGHGYGAFGCFGKIVATHRFSYEKFLGKIPDGLQIDHLCRNRLCVNPNHLEAVTQKENILRGKSCVSENAKKRNCPKCGNKYSSRIHKTKNNKILNDRRCLPCKRNYEKKYTKTEEFRKWRRKYAKGYRDQLKQKYL